MAATTASAPDGPVALVTGARRGLGRAIAEALGDQGFRLIVNDVAEDDGFRDTLACLHERGVEALGASADIADLDAHAGLLRAGLEHFGRIDCLVNNAGVSVLERGDLLDASVESLDRCLSVNLRGTFFLTQRFARYLIGEGHAPATRHRSIVNITSANADMVSINRGEYCISKAGASMLTRLFATRLADEGIGVYEVRPGLIETEMTAQSKERYDSLVAEGGVPARRWGRPEDVGRVVATLAEGRLPYTVGQPVFVDGGLSIPRF